MKKMKKLLAVVLSALIVVLAFAGCSAKQASGDTDSDLAKIQEKGTLVVGITDFAPMDYKDENGKWIGFDADLANLVGEKLGVKVEFIEIDWDNKFFELETGNIDCIWNGMTITDEVKLNSNPTKAYAKNKQIVVTKKELASTLKTVDDIKSLKFAVENGSAGKDAIADIVDEKNVVVTATQADALLEVKSGTSDACVIDSTMASSMIGEGTSYADLATSVVLVDEEYGISFRKGSDATDKVNTLIDEYKEDGTLQKLAEQYNVQLAD